MSLAWMICGFLCFLFGVYSKKREDIELRCACFEEEGVPMLNRGILMIYCLLTLAFLMSNPIKEI